MPYTIYHFNLYLYIDKLIIHYDEMLQPASHNTKILLINRINLAAGTFPKLSAPILLLSGNNFDIFKSLNSLYLVSWH